MTLAVFGYSDLLTRSSSTPSFPSALASAAQHSTIGDALDPVAPDVWEQLGNLYYIHIKKLRVETR